MMVAEAWVHASRRPLYLRPDEYHQAFDFDLLTAPWDATAFERIIVESVRAAREVGSNPTWVLSNHDVVRHATRYGLPADVDSRAWLLDGPHEALDVERGARRARAAAMITLGLPGSAYVYQGDELGLPEVWDRPADVLQDPVWHDSGHTKKGRDGCRVPIPWEPSGPSYGFGDGPGWLPQPGSFATLAASVQADDPDSTLSLYRAALALRRDHVADESGFEMVDLGPDVLAFRRGQMMCVANMGDRPVPLPDGEVVLASNRFTGRALPTDIAAWLTAPGDAP